MGWALAGVLDNFLGHDFFWSLVVHNLFGGL